MDIVLGAVVGLVVAGLVFLIGSRQQKRALLQSAPSLTGQDIELAMSNTLAKAMNTLAERSREDRDEAIQLATDRVVQSGGEDLGRRADVITERLEKHRQAFDAQATELRTEITRLREQHAEKFGNVDNAVTGLVVQTQALTKILSSSQGRGNWGERMLEDILAQSGFKRKINYERQEVLEGGGRPDYSFYLPPDRVLYLDSKFPADNYIKYCEATNDASRKTYRDSFISNVEDRVQELAKRDYPMQGTGSPIDYVLLFIPNEGIIGFIQQEAPNLVDVAVQQKVVLCSPLTLYVFLSVVHQATSSFQMDQNANEVLRLLSAFGKSWNAYVKYLVAIAKSFDNIQKKLKSVTVGKIFKSLNANVERINELAEAKGVESSPNLEIEIDENLVEIDEGEEFED